MRNLRPNLLDYVYDNDCLDDAHWDEVKNVVFRQNFTERNMSHLAALGKRLHMLQWLHERDMLDLDSKERYGLTVLHLVAWKDLDEKDHNIASEDAACLKCLVWLHSIGLLDPKFEDKNGYNLTHFAVGSGYLETTNWLVSQDLFVPTSSVLKDGLTIFCLDHGYLEQLKWLHSRGMLELFVGAEEDGNHIGHRAAYLGNVAIIEWLHKDEIVDLTRVNKEGHSMAAWAARGGAWRVLDWLTKTDILHEIIASPTELSDASYNTSTSTSLPMFRPGCGHPKHDCIIPEREWIPQLRQFQERAWKKKLKCSASK